MWPERSGARSSVRGHRAWPGAAAALATGSAAPAASQSPHAANPERPTFATHAYAVAPGYAEVEQGLAARGTGSLREATSWDVNLKVGLSRHVQLGLFGPLYARTSGGSGVGDLGAATIRLTEWAVVDAGGAVGATGGTPDQLFLGITTNLGRLF